MAAITKIIVILLVLDLVTDIYPRSLRSHGRDVLDGIHPIKDHVLDSSPHKIQKKPSPEKRNTTKSQTRPPRKKFGSKPSLDQNFVIKQETGLQTRHPTDISPFLSKEKFQQDNSQLLQIFNGFDSSARKSDTLKPLNKFKDDNESLGNKDMELTKVKENEDGKSDNALITGLYDHSKKEENDDDSSVEDYESEGNNSENTSEHSPAEQHDYNEDVSEQDYKPKRKPKTHDRNEDKFHDEKGSKHPPRSKPRDDDEDLNKEEEDDVPFHQEIFTKQPKGKNRYHWLESLEEGDILPPSVRRRIAKLEQYGPKYIDDLYHQQSAAQRRKYSPFSDGEPDSDKELEDKLFRILKDRSSQHNQDTRHSFRPEVKHQDPFHSYPSSIGLRNRENGRNFAIPHGRGQLTPYNKNPLQNDMFGADERHAETYSNSYLDPKNIKQDSLGNVYVGFPESELQRVLSSNLGSSPSTKLQWPPEKTVSHGIDNSFPETKYVSYLSSDNGNVHPIRPPGSRDLRVQEASPSVLKPDEQRGLSNMFGDARTVQNGHCSCYPPDHQNVPLNRPNVREWHPQVEEPFPLPSRNNVIRPGNQNYMHESESPVVDDWTLSVLEKILGPANNQNARRGMTDTVWQPITYRRYAKRSISTKDDIKYPELSESRIKRSQSQYRSLRTTRSTSNEEVDHHEWRPLPDSSVGNPYVHKISGGNLPSVGERSFGSD